MKTLTRFINLCALTGLMACIEVKDEADTGTDAIDSPDTNDEDEPLPAGYSTEKQWLEDVINYSKEVDGDDDDDDDNVKFGKAPTFKKS